MTLVAIKDMLANPYRHSERYPIRPEKVAALRESLHTTGYWDNIVGRPKDHQVEMAYGHHRKKALEEEYGPNKQVEVITRNLSDEQMLQIMARENMEVFGTSAAVEQETVRAVVEAAAKGTIKLEEPPPTTKKSDIRYAPSFLIGKKPSVGPAVPYTTHSIGSFLALPQRKVSSSLWALQLIEEGLLKESDFNGLSSTQAQAVVEQARKVREREIAAAEAERREAEQDADEAERRRQEAEKERKRLEQKAASAKGVERRQKALEAARAAKEEEQRAEIAKKRADQALAKEKEREKLRVKEAHKKATQVGRAISKKFGAETISVKDASKVAEELAPKPEGPPRDIVKIAARLATSLAGVLTPDRDPKHVAQLTALVKYREKLPDANKKALIEALTALARRAEKYAEALVVNYR
jgi:hypothetical protein